MGNWNGCGSFTYCDEEVSNSVRTNGPSTVINRRSSHHMYEKISDNDQVCAVLLHMYLDTITL